MFEANVFALKQQKRLANSCKIAETVLTLSWLVPMHSWSPSSAQYDYKTNVSFGGFAQINSSIVSIKCAARRVQDDVSPAKSAPVRC